MISCTSVRARLGLLLILGCACNSHPLTSPHAGPNIGEYGISVPVPPPSLMLMPVQRVEIEGALGGGAAPGTRVFLRDTRRGLPGQFVEPEDDGSFFFEGVEIDLGNNCLDVWSQDAQARSSVHSFFRASIDEDDQTVRTEQLFRGCA